MQIKLAIVAYPCNYIVMKCHTKLSVETSKLLSLFKALGDKNRIEIFKYFCNCSLSGSTKSSVNDVKSCCDVDLSVVSRHLAVLKKAGVLSAKKEGKNVYYSLDGNSVAEILRNLADLIEKCCSSQTITIKESKNEKN